MTGDHLVHSSKMPNYFLLFYITINEIFWFWTRLNKTNNMKISDILQTKIVNQLLKRIKSNYQLQSYHIQHIHKLQKHIYLLNNPLTTEDGIVIIFSHTHLSVSVIKYTPAHMQHIHTHSMMSTVNAGCIPLSVSAGG